MRTLVVGDVHGCVDELRSLLQLASADRVVFVGDLFTKGPDPLGVHGLVRPHEVVLGNHDVRLLRWLAGERPRDEHAGQVVRALEPASGWAEWLAACPLFIELETFTVVHAGIHPSGDIARTPRKMATLMRRFPMGHPDVPFWYQQYEGQKGVIFGHDAVRGLVRLERDGLPFIIGLDTGCCYGGALSGYLVEEDRVLQVPAARVYCAPLTKPV